MNVYAKQKKVQKTCGYQSGERSRDGKNKDMVLTSYHV